MCIRHSTLLTFAILALIVCRSSASFEPTLLTCAGASTLDALSDCLAPQIPQAGSNGFVEPSPEQRADWRRVVVEMLQGRCDAALPASLAGIAERRTFTDRGTGAVYCLLMEVLDGNRDGQVDRGWAAFLVNPHATRELHHHAPHPISDAETDDQAIALFGETQSRGYLLAGAHRWSNDAASGCQGSYAQADVAHNDATMFHATNEALARFYGTRPWWAIQWHGMAAADCRDADVYLSHGRNVAPAADDLIIRLKARLAAEHPSWKVGVPGDNTCNLNGTFNVQGRLLNGVAAAEVCRTPAQRQSGRFVHIEQDAPFREAKLWAGAVAEVFPAATR